MIFTGDLLRSQVFFDRDGVVGATLDGGIVAHDDAFPPGHTPDTGDQPRARCFAAVHAVCSERREFEERRAGVEQQVDPVSRQQFASRHVLGPSCLAATLRDLGKPLPQFRHQFTHHRGARDKLFAISLDGRFDDCHARLSVEWAPPEKRQWIKSER